MNEFGYSITVEKSALVHSVSVIFGKGNHFIIYLLTLDHQRKKICIPFEETCRLA